MPSVAEKRPSVEDLSSYFPLTFPIPTPTTHPDLITTNDLHREEDLVHSLKLPEDIVAVLGPLASPSARLSLQRLTFIYEAALTQFSNSFKLWKSYLNMRMSYVLGSPRKEEVPEMKEALEEAEEYLEEWEMPLDPIVGWEEWKSLIATFERALMWLPKLPRLWLMYISIFFHPRCPSVLSYTHARRTFDRALRTLPPSLHSRIWTQYLLWVEKKGGEMTVTVYRRYLAVDPSLTERFTSLLLAPTNSAPRPLEAAKLLLSLARKAARAEYTSPEGKSPYQLLEDWIEVVEKYPEEVGLDVDDTVTSNAAIAKEDAEAEAEAAKAAQSTPDPASTGGQLIRMGGPAIPVTADGKPTAPYSEDEDPVSPRKLNIEAIIRKDGLNVYKDQAGRLWTGLATYWLKRAEFERAKDVFELGMTTVLTLRDFTQIFDAYLEFGESLISALMQSLEDEEDEEDAAETEKDLDERVKEFEALTDRRPFLHNDVLIRRNPNDVQEWEKRVALWGENDDEVAKTYTKALETIIPRKATPNLHRLYVNFAKFYEEGGVAGQAEPDLDSARKILEKGTKVNFKLVEDLAEIWCEWSEMELRHENYDEAIRVMQRATAIPKNTKISYHDHTISAQARLFKSLKLWSFYVDLEESIVIVNYAAFLEENDYFEDSFKVYERGVELFTFPVSFEIWNIYLSKFVKRYGGSKLERARDLFEQALEKCPPKSCKPLFLMYAQLEEDYGLAKRSMSIYERATQVVSDEDKFEMFTIYIAKATANFGLPATRPIYERALEVLPDRQTAEMCLRFAALERKLGEIDRARAIYAHASQFCDPRTNPQFWSEWNTFEIETGSEDTFREMLRIKRSVQAQFNTEASYLAAQTISARQGAKKVERKQAYGGGNGPAFVAAKKAPANEPSSEDVVPSQANNADEIQISDDEM
ncbi:hypothetical protein BDZ97DRAFT_1902300 [Flammula alnicola]|nr:hypothetical protein BDZ97DRAFT_1902300 [Flammula alnicola]